MQELYFIFTYSLLPRIRPRNARETIDNCQSCTTVTPGQSQVWIGQNHAFTYDEVLDVDSTQDEVFVSVKPLVEVVSMVLMQQSLLMARFVNKFLYSQQLLETHMD